MKLALTTFLSLICTIGLANNRQDVSGFRLRACPVEAPYCVTIQSSEAHAGILPSLFILKNVVVDFTPKGKADSRPSVNGARATLNYSTRELIVDDSIRIDLRSLQPELLVHL